MTGAPTGALPSTKDQLSTTAVRLAVVATEGPAPGGRAAMYGMLGSLPDRGAVEKVIMDFMDRATEAKQEDPMAGLPGGGSVKS